MTNQRGVVTEHTFHCVLRSFDFISDFPIEIGVAQVCTKFAPLYAIARVIFYFFGTTHG